MVLTQSYEPGFPAEWEGLDYASADEATPRWYGVSYGNGNDGVSHLYPNFYVKTDDPWTLATAATVSYFKAEFQDNALEAVQVDGEADYTIQAVIYEPEDVDPSEAPDEEFTNYYRCDNCEEEWSDTWSSMCNDRCPKCDTETEPYDSDETSDAGSWSEANGAYFLCDVFRVEPDDMTSAPQYDSLEACFNAAELAKAREG